MNNKIFIRNVILNQLDYKSKQDLYENLYLKAIVDTYSRIDKTSDTENNIRDRFIMDLEKHNTYTSNLINNSILKLNFEQWQFVNETNKVRTDIAFFISGLDDFIVECKRLFIEPSKNKPYISEGLNRFVEIKYSANNNYAALIGFVVSGDINSIHSQLKSEVMSNNLITEFQKNNFIIWKLSFKSTHKREKKDPINIYHLFFNFDK